MKAAALCTLLLMMVTAGCLDGDSTPQSTPDDGEGDVGTRVVAPDPVANGTGNVTGAFGWTAAAATPVVPATAGAMSGTQMEFSVASGAASLTVTADWTCPAPACPVHVYLYGPGGALPLEPVAHDWATAGPLTFTVDAPEEGDWSVVAAPEGASAMVTGTFTASVA